MRKGIYTVTLVLAALVMSTAADAASVGGELQASVVYELEAGISSAPLHLTVAVSDDLSGKGNCMLRSRAGSTRWKTSTARRSVKYMDHFTWGM